MATNLQETKRLFAQIFSRRMAVLLLYGFSSGVPLLAVGSTLQTWLVDEGVPLGEIGLYTLVGLPYTLKFIWAPLFDRFSLPILTRRRGWIALFQVALIVVFLALGQISPAHSPLVVGLLALVVTCFSASQDIVLDAYRRDRLDDAEQGLGASIFVGGYRLGMLVSGAGAVGLSALGVSWSVVYMLIGASLLIGLATTWFAFEPPLTHASPHSLREAVVGPLAEFFTRPTALRVLAFILLYKIGDSMAGAMTTPFILAHGYSKGELAAVAKTFGLFATLGGGVLGGALLLRLAMPRALLLFGVLQALSTAMFAALLVLPVNWYSLAGVVAFENVSSGLGTAAYAGFMASLCDRRFSATQYALLSSLMGVPRVILGAPTGYLAEAIGWAPFFVGCAVIAIPGLLLIPLLDRAKTA